jgi:hypothetical protein
MEVLLFACTESAVIDSRTNRLSLFNIVEEIHAKNFPCVMSGLALVLVLLRSPLEPAEASVTVQSSQGGRRLSCFPLSVNFQQHLRTRVVADLNGLTAEEPGTVALSIISPSETLMASWKIRVNHLIHRASQASPQSVGPSVTLPAVSLTAKEKKTRDVGRTKKKH